MDEHLTLEELRQKAIDTLGEALDQYSPDADESGEKAKAYGSVYKEIVTDANTQASNTTNFWGYCAKGAGYAAMAVAWWWMYTRSTRKEEAGEIYATQTDRTIASSGLMGRIFSIFR